MQTRELNNSIKKFDTEFVKPNAVDKDVDPDTDLGQERQKDGRKFCTQIFYFEELDVSS
jgi:hypothetical protein